MPTANRLAQTFSEEPFRFRMPIEPSDYLDRSPLLSEEERRGIAYLLQGSVEHRIAMLCAEEDPLDCHRGLMITPALAAL